MILPEFSENHHSVVTAEAEVAVERNLHLPFPGGVRRNIQITGRIRSLVVDRRRNDAGFNRFDAGDRFQPARSAEAVTGGPFCAAHRNLVGVFAQRSLDRHGFEFVVQLCAGAVSIDVVDLVGAQPGVAHRHPAPPSRSGAGLVM